jgi:hypothetical protein
MEAYLKDSDDAFYTLSSAVNCGKIPDSQEFVLDPSPTINKPQIIPFMDIEDMTNSDFFSLNSPLMTEELIINEKIDFLLNDSPSLSENFSLTYTKTLNSLPSSDLIFLQVSNLFLNTLPQSYDDSFLLTPNCTDQINRKKVRSHTEARPEYLKISNFTLMEGLNNFLIKNPSEDEISEKEFGEFKEERLSKQCNCSWCSVF